MSPVGKSIFLFSFMYADILLVIVATDILNKVSTKNNYPQVSIAFFVDLYLNI